MRYTKMLESLDKHVSRRDLEVRRYNLSDVISESYKLCYESDSDSNFHKLAEANIEFIRNNPKEDLTELSTKIAQLKSLKESIDNGKFKDSDIFEKEEIKESKEEIGKCLVDESLKEDLDRSDYLKFTDEVVQAVLDVVSQYKTSNVSPQQIKNAVAYCNQFVADEADDWFDESLNKSLGTKEISDRNIKTNKKLKEAWGYNRSEVVKEFEDTVDKIEEYGLANLYDIIDILFSRQSEERVAYFTDYIKSYYDIDESSTKQDKRDNIDESDEPELTDDELEELTKHLQEYRKKKGIKESTENKFTMGEKDGLFTIYSDDKGENIYQQYPSKEDAEQDGWVFDIGPEEVSVFKRPKEECSKCKEIKSHEDKIEDCDAPKKSWSDMKESLSNYSKLSTKKAFYKTFKKLNDKLSEGTALTRQESLDLYKATNSAMTQLSVELEHNPDFLATFNEATSILREDENAILEALCSGKCPSKKTLKSISKFAEAILHEDDEADEEILEPEDTLDPEIIDEPIEDTPEEDIEKSPDEEAFDQDYADARQELHDEIVAAHGTSEDPVVQDKIDMDAIDVKVLQGEDPVEAAEEVAAERAESEVGTEDIPSEEIESEEETDESTDLNLDDITPDELEELKKKLKEMRESKDK